MNVFVCSVAQTHQVSRVIPTVTRNAASNVPWSRGFFYARDRVQTDSSAVSFGCESTLLLSFSPSVSPPKLLSDWYSLLEEFFFSRSQRAVTPDPCQTRASNQEWGRSSGRRDAPNDARMWTGSRGRRLQRKTNEATLSLLTVGKSWAQRKGRNRFDIVRFWTDELDLESLHWLDTITVQIVLRHRG